MPDWNFRAGVTRTLLWGRSIPLFLVSSALGFEASFFTLAAYNVACASDLPLECDNTYPECISPEEGFTTLARDGVEVVSQSFVAAHQACFVFERLSAEAGAALPARDLTVL